MVTDDGSNQWNRVVGPRFYETCAHCERSLNSGEWYPVVTSTVDDGDAALHSFCDEECRTVWVDGETGTTSD